jgi:wobble nucleotide-excising tRNase
VIESIHLKNIATYDSEGVKFENLKKINFIYGTNGCGKTTLSNFIHDSTDQKFIGSLIKWKNDTPVRALVYNKLFRDKNFGKGKLSGVFTIGEATAEQIKIIEEKSEKLKGIKAEGIQKRETLDKLKIEKESLDNDFRESVWSKIFKKYERIFKEAFTGTLHKEPFKNKIIQEFNSNTSSLIELEKLQKNAEIIFGDQPVTMELIGDISFSRVIEIESDEIWKKIIVGKADVDIAKLIQRLNISDWVNQGRSYIQDEKCPFCQQATITAEFKSQIEVFFDETYLADIEKLKRLKNEYSALMQNAINQLNQVEAGNKILKNSKLDIEKFSSCLKTLIGQNSANSEYLLNKSKEPSRAIELMSIIEQSNLLLEIINSANFEIRKHNSIVANYTSERRGLVNSIWKFVTEEHKQEISAYIAKRNGLEKGIENLEKQRTEKLSEYSRLDSEIKELGKNVTSIQPSINEINRILKSYGFMNFEIVSANEPGFYQIQREDGTIAETTLSEGEITFITFLYYLQLTKGGMSEDEVKNERILVIDDPISSLDSNVLFVVSTLIKNIINDIKNKSASINQLILLTHNVYFHKEVSFIDGRTKVCSETNYWILRRNDKVTRLQCCEMKNPIQSSYGLLWQELKSDEIKSGISIQNIMRRIIENYFKLLGKHGDDYLISKFGTKEEKEICKSLISWINDGSHSINDDLFIELQDRTIEMYKKVFKNIFILTDHEGHYNMMMNIEVDK